MGLLLINDRLKGLQLGLLFRDVQDLRLNLVLLECNLQSRICHQRSRMEAAWIKQASMVVELWRLYSSLYSELKCVSKRLVFDMIVHVLNQVCRCSSMLYQSKKEESHR